MSTKYTYTVVDPGGNITALVRSVVGRDEYASIARRICVEHPQIEQVGFLLSSPSADICLEMAGGEFCGNALRAAGAVIARELGKTHVHIATDVYDEPFLVEYSNAVATVCVPRHIITVEGNTCHLPGISHVLRKGVPSHTSDASAFVTPALSAKKAVGLMQYVISAQDGSYLLTPTVWVRVLDTLVSETACASGTIALAEYLYRHEGRVNTVVAQPSGALFTTVVTADTIALSGPVHDLYTSVLV